MSTALKLSGKRILFASVPADGHFNPLSGLAIHLKEQGNDVRWYTSAVFSKKLETYGIPHYRYVKALNLNVDNMEELFPARKTFTDMIQKLNFDLVEVFARRSEEYYEDMKDIYASFPFDIVIADSMFSAIPFIRHKMNIPVISIGIIPLAAESKDLAPYGLALPPAANEEQRAQYAKMREDGTNILFKEAVDVYDEILTRNGVPHTRGMLFDILIREASLHLQIGSPGFEYERSDMGGNVRFIGALYPPDSTAHRTEWFDERLNKYKTALLVTQGTVDKSMDKLLEPTLAAFKDTDILVIATTSGARTEELRQKYAADNIIVEDYISFGEVMPHVDVYVTNGGYGGTLLGIQHKLPIVAAGIHEGKSEICARVGYFNLGVNLATETPTPDQLRESVQQVLRDATYAQQVSRLSDEIGEYDAHNLCVQYIQELLN
ncbi:glycosyltransferase [Chitinophaga agrisoli]|uniref:Glycosyltransferase n=1 Tax=Chitinophaga agrisoli TaxID=2607653 RepID=A0A5B2VJ80_9BACT|nr:nucleotide disphospho-sugar-binding domain-containing protein [Chitinophaga agrisoli]KAA2238586.1 glycosyltransferase [Chitinophaga agrisoli]